MRVLALCGSPRPAGNTAFLLQSLAERVRKLGHTAEVLHLPDLRIQECNGCLVCEATDCTGDCTLVDDMQAMAVPKLLAADAVVLGSPTYFDLPSAQIKRFMDRTNMILSRLTEKKLSFGLVVVGQSGIDSLDATCRALRRYCQICGMTEVEASPVLAVARDEGDVRSNPSAMRDTERLAEALVRARDVP